MNNLSQELRNFTGTEHYYKLSAIGRFNSTDGVKYVAEKCGAYWLIDAIASYQYEGKVRKHPFQAWKLEVKGSQAVLTMTDGNDSPPIVTQHIELTDFPETITLWLVDGVLMLPSEY